MTNPATVRIELFPKEKFPNILASPDEKSFGITESMIKSSGILFWNELSNSLATGVQLPKLLKFIAQSISTIVQDFILLFLVCHIVIFTIDHLLKQNNIKWLLQMKTLISNMTIFTLLYSLWLVQTLLAVRILITTLIWIILLLLLQASKPCMSTTVLWLLPVNISVKIHYVFKLTTKLMQ